MGKTGTEELEQEWNQKHIPSVFKIVLTEAAAAKNLAFETTPYMVGVLTKLAVEFGMHNRYGPLQHVALVSRWLCPGGMPVGLGATWTQGLRMSRNQDAPGTTVKLCGPHVGFPKTKIKN